MSKAKPDFSKSTIIDKFANPADFAFNNTPQNSVLPESKKTTPKRTFEGKQHIHLLLPNEQAEAIKHLAKIRNLSVNKLMQEILEKVILEWKPALDQLEAITKKCNVTTRDNTDKDPLGIIDTSLSKDQF